MARLKPGKRAGLPDRAFAYVDSAGRRRLPIHDRAHVRNALARFNQVAFEDHAAREGARRRLLNAAKKYRIVPVGFITGQLQSERQQVPAGLPRGFVTLLMTDIEESTVLLRELGDRYGALLKSVRAVLRRAVAAIERARDRRACRRILRRLRRNRPPLSRRPWQSSVSSVAARGMMASRYASGSASTAVARSSRIPDTSALPCTRPRASAPTAHGGQIVVSAATRASVVSSLPIGIRFRSLGRHRLAGLPEAEALFQLQAEGLHASFPRLRTGRSAAARGRRGVPPMPEVGQLELPDEPV